MLDQAVFSQLLPPPDPAKIAQVLLLLAKGETLDPVKVAELKLDHCLHTTIDDLRKVGVAVNRGRACRLLSGKLAMYRRYWIDCDQDNLRRSLYLLVERWGYRMPGNNVVSLNFPEQKEQQSSFQFRTLLACILMVYTDEQRMGFSGGSGSFFVPSLQTVGCKQLTNFSMLVATPFFFGCSRCAGAPPSVSI